MAIVFGPTRWQALSFNPLAFAELGGAAAGGYIICCNGGTAWVIAPGSTEVSRNWFAREDAITTAEAQAACGDWFIPTCDQGQNPGSTCLTYWDEYSNDRYWTSSGTSPFNLTFHPPTGSLQFWPSTSLACVRAFRCVAY